MAKMPTNGLTDCIFFLLSLHFNEAWIIRAYRGDQAEEMNEELGFGDLDRWMARMRVADRYDMRTGNTEIGTRPTWQDGCQRCHRQGTTYVLFFCVTYLR
jgi:hypothetical protein